jgi:integrase
LRQGWRDLREQLQQLASNFPFCVDEAGDIPEMADRKRDLALFNLAIDSKLGGRGVVALKVEDIAPHGYAVERATVRQKKTGQPVRFEVTEQTRQAVDDYLLVANRKRGEFLFAAQRQPDQGLSIRQYARLVGDWIRGIGLDPCMFGTHSLRRTKATLIYHCTGNLRAVQLLPCWSFSANRRMTMQDVVPPMNGRALRQDDL